MAGINGWLICTLGGGVVGWRVGVAEEGRNGGGLVSQCSVWGVGGFIGGTLDGATV
jgi:hypothetical protein